MASDAELAALGDLEMQDDTMKYDPATGEQRPYPSHAAQWRRWHGLDCAWLFDPWTGRRRNALDVGSDINGRLIVPAGTLGGDMNCGAPMQNTANAIGQRGAACGASAAPTGCASNGSEKEE